jgi:hypothetical protein
MGSDFGLSRPYVSQGFFNQTKPTSLTPFLRLFHLSFVDWVIELGVE